MLLEAPVRRDPLERASDHEDARVPVLEQPAPEVGAARKPDVGEQPAVAVAPCLRPVAAEDDAPVERQPLRLRGRAVRVARSALGRVDPEHPDAFRPARDTHVDRVPVDDADDLPAQREVAPVRAGLDDEQARSEREHTDEEGKSPHDPAPGSCGIRWTSIGRPAYPARTSDPTGCQTAGAWLGHSSGS
jgi:hypothetical protein